MYIITTRDKKRRIAKDYQLTSAGHIKMERLDGAGIIIHADQWESIADLPTAEIADMVRRGSVSAKSKELWQECVEDAEVMDA